VCGENGIIFVKNRKENVARLRLENKRIDKNAGEEI
jgi:hypothetical protein